MSEKKELDKIREKIDELDAELLQLLNRRSSLAMEAGKRKKEEVVYRPERESFILKRLKKINPTPLMTLGEHKDEDFIEADVVVYSSSVDPNLPQLTKAKEHGAEVFGEFAFAYENCEKPVIAVCGSKGRSTVAHMIGFALKLDKKNVFVGGTNSEPFCIF